ncbi:Flavin-dependent oxidoreductase, luciferase family (includes alkanesulfonate monooxygenase SsuD and methylene tetrahydromethanopterin reductase) [Arthrobacter alpinus]|uniref:Flavin-dependent oxidoreductase, luciferase family (Includes alkanesulfonate monooxygenase SsuD and methylene tetrahydromethanopterin reductase) n=1 Tax=Arthrobacter alpinus TaxID=656366 RepID=A0A1H5FHC0_9MICC|nr:LLM class flavin-dependent oxidoreductase [Arthrobacter alpinus]SEE02825.1 Flavin-dependent oxidoreductase, luciferase family (includes alkanesulfonate monooxygenase SsuD and methylene tetrahydromethanopterin reductase) [Arthrobacter alpinus]
MTFNAASQTGFTPTGQLHFGVNLLGPAAQLGFDELRTLAQTAERGLFSLLTLDERYWLREDPGAVSATDPSGSNDVATLLAALAAVTENIGLVAAAAPDYDDPADLTRRIAALDSISARRAAWHILADGAIYGDAALESDNEGIASADGRRSLIESTRRDWEALAKEDPKGPVETLGAFECDGQLYSVGLGALRQCESSRGPVIIHDAESAQDVASADFADVIISVAASLEEALTFRRDVVARSLQAGRGADAVKIIQTATFVLAPTADEAVGRADWMREQLPDSVWDARTFIGSYAGVAETLLDFARSGAVDGFTVMPWLFANELADIVNHLVPELQARGAYPADYAASTLRENLGLSGRGPGIKGGATHTLPVIEVGDLDDVRLDLDLRMEVIVQKMQG